MTRYWWHQESDCVFAVEDDDGTPAEQGCTEVEHGDFLRYAFFGKTPFEPMRVIVCGGRDYLNMKRVYDVLDELQAQHACKLVIVEGGAKGADGIARAWVAHFAATYVENETHLAAWDAHGKAAGMIRNREMLQAGAELVIAFPGGRGTANMVHIAEQAGVAVRRIDW